MQSSQTNKLRKAIQAGLDSGEATKVENISDFLHSIMKKAKERQAKAKS